MAACVTSVLLVALALGAAPGSRARGARMEVQDVWRTDDGQFVVVLRTLTAPLRLLPIWIGEGEAVAIRMRLDRQEPPRPLTLNLLDQVLARANIRVTDVRIDGYRDGLFLGRVRLRQSSRAWEMEARPSDAIGLAVARRVPIVVAASVLDGAAVAPDELVTDGDGPGPDGAPRPGAPAAHGRPATDESL